MDKEQAMVVMVGRGFSGVLILLFLMPLVPMGFWLPLIALVTIATVRHTIKDREPGNEWIEEVELWLNKAKG